MPAAPVTAQDLSSSYEQMRAHMTAACAAQVARDEGAERAARGRYAAARMLHDTQKRNARSDVARAWEARL